LSVARKLKISFRSKKSSGDCVNGRGKKSILGPRNKCVSFGIESRRKGRQIYNNNICFLLFKVTYSMVTLTASVSWLNSLSSILMSSPRNILFSNFFAKKCKNWDYRSSDESLVFVWL
jgi:hypothetical protein